MIRGMTCELYGIPAGETDPFGAPASDPALYKTVENVLVSPVSSEDNAASEQMYGRAAIYELSFPKSLERSELEGVLAGGYVMLPDFSGDAEYDPLGEPTEYIEANVPLFWNIKLKVTVRR